MSFDFRQTADNGFIVRHEADYGPYHVMVVFDRAHQGVDKFMVTVQRDGWVKLQERFLSASDAVQAASGAVCEDSNKAVREESY